jgi:23S rRNA (cytidine1920-2'-O)/16S rRNA (cytidine1409-2'-O)-methyltransferase
MKERLDKYLVTNNFIGSRNKSKELIKSGNVKVNDKIVTKCSYTVKNKDKIEIVDDASLKYVSRAGLKLEGAIDAFGIDFKDKNVMDIGSSTGGFTDCALKHGAKRVVAIDVGTDLMDDCLRNNNNVDLHEQLNFKDAPSELFEDIDIIVSDVSFISLKHIIDRIELEDKDYELVFLIKPQFECGKEIAKKYKGIIKDKQVHKEVILDICDYFKSKDYNILDLDVSKIHGKSGNIEYLGHFKRNAKERNINVDNIISKAFNDTKTAVIFTGIQASGKTTFYRKYFSNYVHVNLDTLKKRSRENTLLNKCVEKGESFVVDNTNPSREVRQKYFDILDGTDFEIHGYYFKSSLEDCLERNAKREGKANIPDVGVMSTYEKLEPPCYDEGFDKLFEVEIKDDSYIVNELEK